MSDDGLDGYSDAHWRIDCVIRPSWLKYGIVLMVMLSVVMVCVTQNLTLMGWLILGVMVVLLSVWQIRQGRISHLTEPPKSVMTANIYEQATHQNRSIEATWLIRHHRHNTDPQLWQGYLSESVVYPMVVQLRFKIVEPFSRNLTVNVWQDQVDARHWQLINVLARL